jgi:hypothetical protein
MSDAPLPQTGKPAAKPTDKPSDPKRDFLSRAGRRALQGGETTTSVGKFWNAYLAARYGIELTERDVIVLLDLAATANIAAGTDSVETWEQKVALAARGFETGEA